VALRVPYEAAQNLFMMFLLLCHLLKINKLLQHVALALPKDTASGRCERTLSEGEVADEAQISDETLRLVYMALRRHSARRDDMLGLTVNLQ
jgi:hypothetical protein